ncbi:MAG: hypothetical protein M3462_10575 [Chloroflexota bacterium]|nr:hypothetical protein [Chloroflexota bacterium]
MAALGIALVLVVLRELVHEMAIRAFDATPTSGVGRLHTVVVYRCCAAPDHRFRNATFVVMLLAPRLLISGAGTPAVAWAPWS